MSDDTNSNDPALEMLLNAIQDDSVTKLYANGFVIGNSSSDSFILLKLNENPVAVVNLSIETAKAFAISLTGNIERLERNTRHTFLSLHEIRDRLDESDER